MEASEDKHICYVCEKLFKSRGSLRQHSAVHTDVRVYSCFECDKSFRQLSHLSQHLRIHRNEKPYTCLICKKSFRQRAILTQHSRVHSNERPYKCVICRKRFKQKSTLDQHTRNHVGPRPYSCVFTTCKHWFSDYDEIKLHVLELHLSKKLISNSIIAIINDVENYDDLVDILKKFEILEDENSENSVETRSRMKVIQEQLEMSTDSEGSEIIEVENSSKKKREKKQPSN